MTRPTKPDRCPACGQAAAVVWVHGHGQCAACGTNIEPCCDGAATADGRDDDEVRVSLAPVVGVDPTVLVLGSMPGEESLRRQEYYAHPQNQFWRILGQIVGARPDLPYGERLLRLQQARVALWDVVHTCRRDGSADATITDVEPNAIAALLAVTPTIRRVLCNGQKAHDLFVRRIAPQLAPGRVELIRVPSTSPAHAGMRMEQKLAAWRRALVPSSAEP